MKNQSTEVMVTHIRAILEQNQNPEDLVSRDDVRTLSIEALIANFLEEAVSMAVDNADEKLFAQFSTKIYGSSTTSTPYYYRTDDANKLQVPASEALNESGDLKSGYSQLSVYDGSIVGGVIIVPKEMQRLLQITSSEWSGVVKDLIEKSSPIYRMCQNKYLNAVGVKDRPVAFKDFAGGVRIISLYPKPKDASISYIEKPTIANRYVAGVNTSETTEVPSIPCDDLIYEGACFYCAYLVAMVQGWASANTYRQEAVEALKVVNADNVRAAAAKMAQG